MSMENINDDDGCYVCKKREKKDNFCMSLTMNINNTFRKVSSRKINVQMELQKWSLCLIDCNLL